MLSPLWQLVVDGSTQNVPRILRALYTFETFQVMRRMCRQQDTKFFEDQLDRLLGVDFEARGTPLPEPFSRPDLVHGQEVVLDRDFFDELCKALDHVKYVTTIVPLFQAIRHEEPVARARMVPQISD